MNEELDNTTQKEKDEMDMDYEEVQEKGKLIAERRGKWDNIIGNDLVVEIYTILAMASGRHG